jgi:YesN/AraC family two-component response regulator
MFLTIQHVFEKLHIRFLAADSEECFFRTEQTGVGFSDYITTQRIEKAKQLLLSGDVKIYEAAEALGFESAFYFSKVFKKKEGCSPKEFIQSKTEH